MPLISKSWPTFSKTLIYLLVCFDEAFTHYINVLLCAYIDYSYMYGVGFKSFEFEIHISKDLNEHWQMWRRNNVTIIS